MICFSLIITLKTFKLVCSWSTLHFYQQLCAKINFFPAFLLPCSLPFYIQPLLPSWHYLCFCYCLCLSLPFLFQLFLCLFFCLAVPMIAFPYSPFAFTFNCLVFALLCFFAFIAHLIFLSSCWLPHSFTCPFSLLVLWHFHLFTCLALHFSWLLLCSITLPSIPPLLSIFCTHLNLLHCTYSTVYFAFYFVFIFLSKRLFEITLIFLLCLTTPPFYFSASSVLSTLLWLLWSTTLLLYFTFATFHKLSYFCNLAIATSFLLLYLCHFTSATLLLRFCFLPALQYYIYIPFQITFHF